MDHKAMRAARHHIPYPEKSHLHFLHHGKDAHRDAVRDCTNLPQITASGLRFELDARLCTVHSDLNARPKTARQSSNRFQTQRSPSDPERLHFCIRHSPGSVSATDLEEILRNLSAL